MPLDLTRENLMENLWESLDKTPDGEHIRYTPQDVEQLWWLGFVDTEKYDMSLWKRVFEPYRNPDGSFVLSKDQFLALDQYRYIGEVHVPFDSMQINEGKYTDEGLEELVEASIRPSCSLPREKVYEYFEKLKQEFRQPDGLILIRKPAKHRIKALLDNYPSPIRNMEILIDEMIQSKGEQFDQMIDRAEAGAASVEAAKQASRFSTKPRSRVESKAKQLEKLQKVKKRIETAADDGSPKVELKRIRRSRKGFRG